MARQKQIGFGKDLVSLRIITFTVLGTLAVRTVLSILPTLSREYDQHFRSFTQVPKKFSDITKNSSKEGSGIDENSEDIKAEDLNSENTTKEEAEQEDVIEKEDDDNDESLPNSKFRGSRCFEVLGIDVMIDSKLRPTLIEFNHLPR